MTCALLHGSCRQQGPGGVVGVLEGTEQSAWLPHSHVFPSAPQPVPPFPWGGGTWNKAGWRQRDPPPPPALGLETHSSLQVKVWRLPASGQALPSGPGLLLGPEDAQVEVLQFHPTADGILLSAVGRVAKVWDATKQQPLTGRATATAPPWAAPSGSTFCLFAIPVV